MVGQNIGKYRVTEQIGRGGMGTVYCAVDETLHREVAIKVLNAGLNDPTVARRFRAEAVTIARLNHPGIATIYELVQHDGQWLMVMEYVRGETLERLVSQQGPLSVARASDLIMQTLAALAHAHGLGVVHRDLKPANLMLGASGAVKIMDFGIARVAGAEQLTSAGFMMGTPAYMAPEQVLGQDIDARTDLYATGLVLYHLVSGTLPFKGDTPIQMAQLRIHGEPTPVKSVRPDLPDWVGQVIDIALARDASRRFQTALLFREAIRRGLDNLPIEQADSGVPPELVVTAAPGTIPVATPSGRRPAPSEASTEAVTAPVPAVAAAAATAATSATAHAPAAAPQPMTAVAADLSKLGRPAQKAGKPAISQTSMFAGAGVLVLLVALGLWFGLRSPAPATGETPATPAPTATTAADAGTSVTPAPATPGSSPAAPEPAASTATPPAGEPPAAAPAAIGATTPAPVTTANAGPAPPAAPPAGTSASPAARSGGPRGTGAAERTATYEGLRGFVTTRSGIDERPAMLIFADGRVTLADADRKVSFAALPYGEVRSAAYTRGRNPRWYPTLAGPAANADLPGGLFRRDAHWLALQSRVSYMIVRMNDGDWQRIVATVQEILGIKVDTLDQ